MRSNSNMRGLLKQLPVLFRIKYMGAGHPGLDLLYVPPWATCKMPLDDFP